MKFKDKHISIGVIGSGPAIAEKIEAHLKAKEMNNIIIVSADIPIAEATMPAPIIFKPNEPIIPTVKWLDYKDGQTSRRERRKKERKRNH